MVALKNQSVYYITIKTNRDSGIKTLFAGEDYLGLAGFFVDFDKARRFNCPVSAEKWFRFHFDEETLPPAYYDWNSITIEELKLVPVDKIHFSKENHVPMTEEKPKRTYNKKKKLEGTEEKKENKTENISET